MQIVRFSPLTNHFPEQVADTTEKTRRKTRFCSDERETIAKLAEIRSKNLI